MASKKTASSQEVNVAKQKEKSDNFKRLGTQRLAKALTAIERLEPLGNRSAYVFDDSQVNTILRALDEARKNVADAFSKQEAVKKAAIQL